MQYLYFKSRSKDKSSSDVADATKKHQERREEEVTEEPKRFMMQEMTGEFSLFEETLLVFEAWNLNILQYAEVLGAIQNAIQCYCAILWGKKLLPKHHWIISSRG